MRGNDLQQSDIFSYVSPEERVPQDHPLGPVRRMADQAFKSLAARFDTLYAKTGRPSVAPEKLLRALLLQVLYSIRSERMLIEQLDYNPLFRWFVGLNMDDLIWVPTVFTKNRDRVLEGNIVQAFFGQVLAEARTSNLLSDEHFSVNGTLIEAWASQKSFRPKDDPNTPDDGDAGNREVDFHGEKRSNATRRSTTDPDARLAVKGDRQTSKLAFSGNAIIENRNGLVVATQVLEANGTAKRDATLMMLAQVPGNHRISLGADKGYDAGEFVHQLRGMQVTPHIAQNITAHRGSNIDGRTTRHAGYALSQRKRKRIERVFGWLKTVAGLRKTRHRRLARVGWVLTFAAAAYNLVRMRNLLALSAEPASA